MTQANHGMTSENGDDEISLSAEALAMAARSGAARSGAVKGEEDREGDAGAGAPDGLSPAEGDSRVAELEARLAEAGEKLLRALADADNARKRAERDRIEAGKYAVSNFARDLLNVSDNLRRALEAIPEEARGQDGLLQTIYAGVEATERELLRAFELAGLRPVDALGKPFDPNLHEVMFETETADHAPGTVLHVVQQGYTIHDRLLRPARVGVAKGGAGQASRLNETA